MADLTQLGPFQAAALVLERFPEDHAHVAQSLQSQPELQYQYLQAASQVRLAVLCVVTPLSSTRGIM